MSKQSKKEAALFALRVSLLLKRTITAARYCGLSYIRYMQLVMGDAFREGELDRIYDALCVVKGNQIADGKCQDCGSFVVAHALTPEPVCIDCFYGHKRRFRK